MLKELKRLAFRTYRALRGRDNCEVCDGKTCVRGNENVIDGIVMCDDCHARRMGARFSAQRVARSIRGTLAINREQSPEVLRKALSELADALERGDVR